MLAARDLRKSFGGHVAVDGLSFEAVPGEVFGLLGPNGAGKTTTIRMAIGLLRPDGGSVTVGSDGAAGSPENPEVRRRIGVAPQALALYDELTAEENLLLFGRLYGLGGRELTARVQELLGAVGLAERKGSRVKTYSGGMKRRLNLAAGLVHDPDVVLLDEPTAGVDPQSRNSLLDMVQELKEAGKAIVYTTHYMEEAQKLCDRVGIVDHGKLLALDTVEGLIAAHGGQHAVIGETAAGVERVETTNPVAEVTRMLSRGDVTSLRIERPDLETVFLNLTGRRLRD